MQYEHTREQSAEFLRVAVGHMGRQQANFDPPSYALWYEHAAGLNPALSQILEDRLTKQRPLTNADVSSLYARHIGTRETEALARIEERLLTVMRDTAGLIADTGAHAVEFGRSLENHSERLRQTNTLQTIEAIVNEMLEETKRMSATNLTLARQLESRALEVESLTQRLEKAETEAVSDPLTGLMNRRGLEQTVAAKASGAGGKLAGCALLLIDVDDLKKINDTHGHEVGDQVLRGVARVLKARIKGDDTAARLGGDEFAVFLPHTNLEGAVAVAEGIRRSLLQAHLRRGRNEDLGTVCVSIGAAYSGEGNLESLMREADAALYEAKREGRNQVRSSKV